MPRTHKRSYFRFVLPSIVATCALVCVACEAVLGAEFDEFSTYDGDGSTPDRNTSEAGAGVSTAAGRAGGRSGDANRGRDDEGGRAASGGASMGGSTGNLDAGGTPAGGGTAGSMRTPDAGGQSREAASDATVLDEASDAVVVADVPSPDTAGDDTLADAATDLTTPASRDGAVGGACTPNEVRSIATCGSCGLFLQVCNSQGVWDAPFCRQEPAACAPGSMERRACSSGGTQVAICTTSCTWSLGDCVAPLCAAGQTEVLPCSICGTQTRTCLATEGGVAWGPFSACAGQGVCAPGTRDATTCGKCGTYSRVCNPTCAWDPWGTCEGEGECLAGATETRSCAIIPLILFGKQTRSCGSSCYWGAYGDCR